MDLPYVPPPRRVLDATGRGSAFGVTGPEVSPWLASNLRRIIREIGATLDPTQMRVMQLRKRHNDGRCDHCREYTEIATAFSYTDRTRGLRVVAELCPTCRAMEPR